MAYPTWAARQKRCSGLWRFVDPLLGFRQLFGAICVVDTRRSPVWKSPLTDRMDHSPGQLGDTSHVAQLPRSLQASGKSPGLGHT